MKNLYNALFALTIAILLAGCAGSNSSASQGSEDQLSGAPAKYIFYFIGDGMAAAQVQLAEAALTSPSFRENYAQLTQSEELVKELNIKSLAITGLATSSALNRYITDSAAAGTALATGSKTNVGVISQDPAGNNIKTIAQMAKEKGMKVGIVSSVSIDHATPACFYAHEASRSNYASISDQLLTSGFDYFAGGSPRWDKRAARSKISKAEAYETFCAEAKEKGFQMVTTAQEFDSVSKGQGVIATLDMLSNDQDTSDGSAMPYTIDLGGVEKADNKISLAQFTAKGIELLDNKKGFFMMIEGGKIDWACHANDAATVAYEVVAFDQAIGVALDFAASHPKETLIVVTGDHDCGGLALGFAGTGYESAFDLLAGAKSSNGLFATQVRSKIKAGDSFEKLLAFACEQFGFTNEVSDDNHPSVVQSMELSSFEVKILREAYAKSVKRVANIGEEAADSYFTTFGGNDPFTTICTNLLNNKAGVDFTSFSHTAVPVMVFAQGANAQLFSGYYDNTDIPLKIVRAAAL